MESKAKASPLSNYGGTINVKNHNIIKNKTKSVNSVKLNWLPGGWW